MLTKQVRLMRDNYAEYEKRSIGSPSKVKLADQYQHAFTKAVSVMRELDQREIDTSYESYNEPSTDNEEEEKNEARSASSLNGGPNGFNVTYKKETYGENQETESAKEYRKARNRILRLTKRSHRNDRRELGIQLALLIAAHEREQTMGRECAVHKEFKITARRALKRIREIDQARTSLEEVLQEVSKDGELTSQGAAGGSVMQHHCNSAENIKPKLKYGGSTYEECP